MIYPTRAPHTPSQLRGCVLLGAAIAALGILSGASSVAGSVLYIASRDWVQVPAIIDHVELSTTRSSMRGIEHTSSRVLCSYHYRWRDQDYRGDRVAFEHGGWSDIHEQERYDTLRQSRGPDAYQAWIDPEDPAQSVLFRDGASGRWTPPVFWGLFVLAGLALSAYGVRGLWRARAAQGSAER